MPNIDDTLLARLKTLLRDQSQAELARRTGRSRNALTRYVQGAKIPLEFGVSLVEEFGVNPSWLLAGEVPVYLADVPATSAELGNELLEMMRAIDNVSKVRLGSLSGRGHARALREVADMLDRYDSLSNRLNQMSRPLLSDLLEQAQQAADERRMDRARALIEAASRLQKFSDDRELSLKLMRVRGLVFHIEQDLDAALELRERTFHATLTPDADLGTISDSATELALVLRSNAFARRAQRAARIGMACAIGEERESIPFARLMMVDALASLELGEFDGIPEAIERATDIFADEPGYAVETAKYQYNLHRGIWLPHEIAGAQVSNFAGASNVLSVSYLSDDEDVIERALKRCREVMQPQMPLNQYHVSRAELVLKAMRGRAIPAEELEPPYQGIRFENFSAYVNRSLLMRHLRDRRLGRMLLDAHACLEQYPADRTPLAAAIAVHLKNVLAGVPANTRNRKLKDLRKKALKLRRERLDRGFGLLRMIAVD